TCVPVAVKEIYSPAVRDFVYLGGARLRFLDLVSDAIAACHVRNLFLCAGQSDCVAAEGVYVCLKNLGRVAMWIHADEKDAHLVRILAQLMDDLRQLGHGCRAYVRAAGVAE